MIKVGFKRNIHNILRRKNEFFILRLQRVSTCFSLNCFKGRLSLDKARLILLFSEFVLQKSSQLTQIKNFFPKIGAKQQNNCKSTGSFVEAIFVVLRIWQPLIDQTLIDSNLQVDFVDRICTFQKTVRTSAPATSSSELPFPCCSFRGLSVGQRDAFLLISKQV